MKPWLLQILFDDPRLVAVAKPAGLATIPGRGESDSVLQTLSRQIHLPCAGLVDPRLRIVHRLDKDTTGVLLLAKDIAAQRHLSEQFQNNQVHKEYLALVAGQPAVSRVEQPAEEQGEIDAPLAPHPTRRGHMIVTKHGKVAQTSWKVERRMRRFTLLRCFPKTGRTHQIRVHLKSVGLPLAIDPLYNPPPPGREAGIFLSHHKPGYRAHLDKSERPLISRLTLHAERIHFRHPDGHEMTVECQLPKDFRATLTQLSKSG